MELYTLFIILISEFFFLLFCYYRTLTYLRFFQQEEYDAGRFIRWIKNNLAFDKRASVSLLISFIILHFLKSDFLAALCLFFAFGYLASLQKDPRKSGKIKLNMTARASRIFSIAFGKFIISYSLLSYLCPGCSSIVNENFEKLLLVHFGLVHFIPFSLILANLILYPIEKWTKRKYKNEAIKKLKRINPYVIGITGSYGKTSVKAALGEVLNNTLAPTFCPPKSINTEMGITREIRENLRDAHKYAVIEMGAYNVGSIKRLCNLTPPNAGIVTVVGMAHLERYGSVERIYDAKSELPQALPNEGMLVCNGDNEGARRMIKEFPKKTNYLYGMKPELGHLDCLASNIEYSIEGTRFKLKWKDKEYNGMTKLLGLSALSNLLGVFTMACALGADPEFVLATLRNIKPVDNRLSLSKEGETYYLRDAYNSNPLGFEAALDVLEKLPANRRILMTPGMIELGHEQYAENKKAAFKAAKICDLVIVVGETNRKALIDGLIEGGASGSAILCCASRSEAFAKLSSEIQSRDVVLIENDLPDLYEVSEKF